MVDTEVDGDGLLSCVNLDEYTTESIIIHPYFSVQVTVSFELGPLSLTGESHPFGCGCADRQAGYSLRHCHQ